MQLERIEGWGIPLVCMAAAAIGIYAQHQRLAGAQVELQKAQSAAISTSMNRVDITKNVGEPRVAISSEGPNEQAMFLADLRQKAVDAGVRLRSWAGVEQENNGSATEGEKNLTPGLIPIASELTIEGPYKAVRDFIAALEPAQPLYIFSNMTWRRTEIGTELKVTITRYVAERPATDATSNGVPGATRT